MSSSACNGDTIHRAAGDQPVTPPAPRRRRCNVHCNHIWSVWYGLLTLALQSYIVYKCITRFLTYIHLPWPDSGEPYLELNLYVGLVGAGVVLLPFFFISFMFKIGNLANDGYKIGYNLSTCSMDPPSVLARSGGLIRNAWYHGGPTGPFIHLVSAFCFLLPRIIIEAKLVEVGFLSRENIWKTDLDWMVPNNDRMVVLSFFTGAGTGDGLQSTPLPTVNHPADQIRRFLQSDSNWWPCSAEYINYGLALLVFAVRYPAVFWKTNKGLSFLFSLQLIGNGIQNMMAFSAMSIMYKVHMIGSQNVLHKYEPFLLNTPICMLLYLLACIIVTASSSVIYMYGYQKFMMFLQKEREKKSIVLQEGKTSLWMYFPHTAAMCTLIALAVCNGPLLYDFTIIYKGSLDGTVLVFVITTILHLFLWIVTWLFLTVKMSWKFKLRVTVGRASVHNAKSIKLVNDIDLHHQPVDKENAPMLIVGFGKTFTVHDQGPKKLIMRTLARAAMETDRALEEEDMYWLKGDTPTGKINAASTNTIMRVHASPSLNKKGSSGADEEDPSQSPRRVAQGQRSPVNNTVQDTDDRIPKESIYGTIRTKGKQRPVAEGETTVALNCHLTSRIEEEDLDRLPPPPVDDGFEESKQPLLAPPKPAPRKGHNQDVLDIHTPRSNRSIDSGLPDSSSTTSSTSPPGQHQPDIDLQQHRKSTSLDNITLPGEGKPNSWKSYSLQRGVLPPSQEEQEIQEKETLVIMRNNSGLVGPENPTSQDQEDIYGRCTNMKLTSFCEGVPSNSPRDPRIIDLAQSTACGAPRQMSTNPGILPNTGIHPNLPQSQHNLNHVPQQSNNFNTLPANIGGPNPQPVHSSVNTLPARVNTSPPRTQPHFNGHHPTGRHFKPFDHRRMNPMAEIQENPYEIQHQNLEIPHPNHETQHQTDPSYGQMTENTYNPDTTYVVHHNKHIPYMPAELKHTNYNTKPQLVHPQVMQYRDSANYSCASSDSG